MGEVVVEGLFERVLRVGLLSSFLRQFQLENRLNSLYPCLS